MADAENRSDRRTRPRRAIAVVVALLLLVIGAGAVIVVQATGHDDSAERSIFDEDGNLAMPMPTLTGPIAVTANDDGSSQLAFSIEYAVSHLQDPDSGPGSPTSTSTTDGAKADAAVVNIGVYPKMANAGPIRLSPVFEQSTLDRELSESTTTRDYSIRITPDATAFLRAQGFGSGDPDQEAAALRHVDIDIQQMRDFKVLDGEWDWQQGRAWTGADQPVSTADITDDSTVTIENSTGDGVAGPLQFSDTTGQQDPTFVDPTDRYATYLSLSGAPVECIDQGDGSNPQGFSVLNGWDIEDGLPPGVIPPGASVTQQVDADESLGTESLDTIQDWATASAQVTLAAFGLTTPGLKSGLSQAVLVGMEMAEFSDPITAALGVPIMAIAELGDAIYEDMTNTCASFANVLNLTAAEPFGAMSSVSWGDQTDGLQIEYDSASYKGTPVDDNVQLAASNGMLSFTSDGTNTTVHPWLAQAPSTACGTGDPTGCDGAGNNVVDVVWTSAEPCPYGDGVDACAPSQADLAGVPEVDIPGTSLCGTDNELCPTVAAPNPDAQEESTADLQTGSYEVVGEYQPDTSITGLAAVDDQSVYGGGSDGTLYRFTVDPSNPTSATQQVASWGGSITTLTALQGQLLVTFSDGGVWRYDPGDGSVDQLDGTDGGVVRAVETGGLVYLATADSMYAVTSDFQLQTVATDWLDVDGAAVTSMAAGADFLFVGFQDGWVMRCDLTDCASSWSPLHDGGFGSDANALAAVGDTLYVGLDDGAVAQIDGESATTTMVSSPGSDGLEWGGMATVDGNVFVGGCVGLQSPVSGDMLGVVVLTGLDASGGTFAPTAPYPNTCQNPTETTTQYKGFQASSYAMAATPATDGHPPLVFASFTINSGQFVYALESTAPFTGELCLPDDGPCPGPTQLPVTPSPGAPAPSGSLAALGDPQITSTCGSDGSAPGFTAATADDPLPGPDGQTMTDGFQLTPYTASGSGCTTSYAWNLSNLGSFPYVLWQGNAYGSDDDLSLVFQGTEQSTIDGFDGSAAVSPASPATLTGAGGQMSVPLSGAGALVLSVTTPAGGSGTVTVTDDTLTSTGQPVPSPAPLVGAAPAACTVGDPTLATAAAGLYPLDDTSLAARDVSGNQNNGLVVDPAGFDQTPGPSAACPDDGALAFDGETSVVQLPSSLDPAVQGDALSLVAWVQMTELPPTYSPLVSNATVTGDYDGVELAVIGTNPRGPSTGPVFAVTVPAGSAVASAPDPLSLGAWHMVAGVYDGTTVTVYVDGVAAGTAPVDTSAGSSIVAATNPLALGFSDQGAFLGQMADAAVVPSALSAAQIAAIYDQVSTGSVPAPPPSTTTSTSTTSTTTTTTPTTGPSPTTAPTSTVPSTTSTVAPTCTFVNASMAGQADALWLLADRSPTAVDASGHGNDATISNAAAYDQAPGPATGCAGSGGLAFDGSSTHVTAPTTLDPSVSGAQLTVVSFFQVSQAADGTLTLVANDDPASSGDGFSLSLDAQGGSVSGGTFAVGAAGGPAQAQWTATLAPGVWHQYVGTYDGTTATAYIDGQPVATAITSGAVNPGVGPVVLGYDQVTGGAFFAGLMADVGIVDQPLSGQQVAGMWAASQRYANAPSTAGAGAGPADLGAFLVVGPSVVALGALRWRRRRALR